MSDARPVSNALQCIYEKKGILEFPSSTFFVNTSRRWSLHTYVNGGETNRVTNLRDCVANKRSLGSSLARWIAYPGCNLWCHNIARPIYLLAIALQCLYYTTTSIAVCQLSAEMSDFVISRFPDSPERCLLFGGRKKKRAGGKKKDENEWDTSIYFIFDI